MWSQVPSNLRLDGSARLGKCGGVAPFRDPILLERAIVAIFQLLQPRIDELTVLSGLVPENFTWILYPPCPGVLQKSKESAGLRVFLV